MTLSPADSRRRRHQLTLTIDPVPGGVEYEATCGCVEPGEARRPRPFILLGWSATAGDAGETAGRAWQAHVERLAR